MLRRTYPPHQGTIGYPHCIDESVNVSEESVPAIHRNRCLHRRRGVKRPPLAAGVGVQRVDRSIFTPHKQLAAIGGGLSEGGGRTGKTKSPLEFEILHALAI